MASAITLDEERLNETFAALANPTRRAILARLAQGEATVNELAAPFDMALPTISKHLKVLSKAGLISGASSLNTGPVRSTQHPSRSSRPGPSSTGRSGKRGSTGWTSTSINCRSNERQDARHE